MSRSNGCEAASDAWPTALRRGLVARAAIGLAFASVSACGGTQASAVADAAADAAQATIQSVGPSDPDPCVTSQQFEFQPIESFVSANDLANQYAAYVSFDSTGLLYQNGQPAVGIDPSQCVTGYSATTPDRLVPKRCGSDGTGLQLLATGGSLDAGANDAGLTDWGLNVSVDLRQNCTTGLAEGTSANPCSFDASGWTGISFWALLGPGSSGTSALATVADPSTAGVLGGPTYPFNELICGNAACIVGTTPDNHCTSTSVPLCLCDPYGKGVGLVNHWAFYAIPFGDLRQKGYGAPESALDLTHVLAFKLSLGQGNWNVWIDNIAFYRPKSQ